MPGIPSKIAAAASAAFREGKAAVAPAAEAAAVTGKAGIGSRLMGAASKGWGKLGTLGQAGVIVGAVDLLLDPAANMLSGSVDDLNLGGRVDRRLERMISGQEKVDQFQKLRMKRDRKVAELTQRNTLLLAQNAPHLFNQLMAGRSLPRGATVIGGEPRTDLVQEVAMGMTQGRFPPPTEGDLNLGGV